MSEFADKLIGWYEEHKRDFTSQGYLHREWLYAGGGTGKRKKCSILVPRSNRSEGFYLYS